MFSLTPLPTLPCLASGDPDAGLAWLDAAVPGLATCEQDPRYHPEGDVLTHTREVLGALFADSAWQGLCDADRERVARGALLHDVGKVLTTRREDDGSITSRRHAPMGAVLARALLYRAGVDPLEREAVCGLVRHHMTPGFLLDGEDPRRRAALLSWEASAQELAMIARADARGRRAPEQELRTHLDVIELFEQACAEWECLTGPHPFSSDHARVMFFGTPGRDPAWEAFDDTRGELTVLCGLPGAGKDTWVAHQPGEVTHISLDDMRVAAGVKAGATPGRVIQDAREQLRVVLRAGGHAVWNTTGLSRDLRGRVLGLARDYRVRTRIVAVEVPLGELIARNRSRPSAQRIPEAVMERCLSRWEFPSLVETHRREWERG